MISTIKYCRTIAIIFSMFVAAWLPSQTSQPAPTPLYQYHTIHDPNGTGKFYMGREIAQVMGPGGIPWLDRPERQSEEMPSKVLAALKLKPNDVVVDFGAGSGFYTFLIAPKLNAGGRVIAVDIQDEMLQTLRARAATSNVKNIEVVKGVETDPHLPNNSVDLVLMVDVYHELSYPYEVMTKVREALKPNGRLVFVEYRKEDPSVPIKEVHKMTVIQLEKEMTAVGLIHVETLETLPWQHIIIFRK